MKNNLFEIPLKFKELKKARKKERKKRNANPESQAIQPNNS